MSSYFMVPAGRKHSLNLSFDFVHDSQALGGYKTLNLLNSNGDPTFLRGVLYTEISSHYIPTPKMNYMRVVINDENWGVYLNAQQFNKDFTRDYFKSTKGTRWKVPGSPGGRAGFVYLGESADEYKRLYQMAGDDNPKAWADLIPAGETRGGARADARRRRHAEVPRPRRRAGEQRRLLDARQRLQHLPGREGHLPRHSA
jgi:hypothetical protein